MTLIESAIMILKEYKLPMRPIIIWEEISKRGLFESSGQTPWATLSTQIIGYCKGVHSKINYKTKYFYRDTPGKYGLLEWLNSEQLELVEEDEKIIDGSTPDATLLDTNLFLEQEWHRWLYKNLENNGLIALGFGKLTLFDKDKQGEKDLGKYDTQIVGEIDMLLKNDKGEIIVIELKRKGTDETVGQICRYSGWVEENLVRRNQKVYGVIIAQSVDDKLRYAIKPIKEHIYYQQLKMSVEFGESSRTKNK